MAGSHQDEKIGDRAGHAKHPDLLPTIVGMITPGIQLDRLVALVLREFGYAVSPAADFRTSSRGKIIWARCTAGDGGLRQELAGFGLAALLRCGKCGHDFRSRLPSRCPLR